MATALMLGGLVLSLLLIWGTGYALVLALTPTVFRPRALEAAVALLLGVCAAGTALIIPAYLVSGARWVDLVTRWTLPTILGLALAAVMVRWRRGGVSMLVMPAFSPRTLLRGAPAWMSIAALLVGAGAIVALRPGPAPTVELYGARAAYGYQISVDTTSVDPEQYVLHARYAQRAEPVVVPVAAVSAASGPATVMLPEGAGLHVELYRAGEEASRLPALRQLVFDLP